LLGRNEEENEQRVRTDDVDDAAGSSPAVIPAEAGSMSSLGRISEKVSLGNHAHSSTVLL
jgi:hypothetical protein